MIAGRYSLDREIGRGASGAVWVGTDEVLGRRVALKRLGLVAAGAEVDAERAEREALLGARLNSAHVVGVYDIVQDQDQGARWLVMEYVEGHNLSEVVRDNGPLSADQAAPLLRQAAQALESAHEAGIAHRDVKPSNILVSSTGTVKLTDFGIARFVHDPSLTQTGMVTGSPSYLAPEVATGGRGDLAADVWALGATACFLLTGQAPYAGDNMLGTLYRIAHEEPPRPSEAGWLAPLLESTMQRDPADRWSMSQVRAFLDGTQVAPGTPRASAWSEESDPTRVVPAVAPAATAPARHATGRNRRRSRALPLLIGAVVLAAILVGVLLARVLNTPGQESDDQASARSSQTATGSTSPSPSPSATTEAPKPTADGMEEFIRTYVDRVGSDPRRSWQMLTPEFQRQSGGLDDYVDFWEDASNGRISSLRANPEDLSVSYDVAWQGHDNGPTTVLDLSFEDGRYLISGERTAGFQPQD